MTIRISSLSAISQFQLTHPWGCDISLCRCVPKAPDFNSHTREGVTNALQAYCHSWRISTHTPVRVWRYRVATRTSVWWISTHTPVRVWLAPSVTLRFQLLFQLTHPWGCDLSAMYLISSPKISTHTPVRVWPRQLSRFKQLRHFNSHTREGVTQQLMYGKQYDDISTHTPVRVWLKISSLIFFISLISTHTPVRVWPPYGLHQTAYYYFNSHTREGVTPNPSTPICRPRFQLTHPWGCDQSEQLAMRQVVWISTHTPVRVWPTVTSPESRKERISTHTPVRVWLSDL